MVTGVAGQSGEPPHHQARPAGHLAVVLQAAAPVVAVAAAVGVAPPALAVVAVAARPQAAAAEIDQIKYCQSTLAARSQYTQVHG